jgi:hypothetical protein
VSQNKPQSTEWLLILLHLYLSLLGTYFPHTRLQPIIVFARSTTPYNYFLLGLRDVTSGGKKKKATFFCFLLRAISPVLHGSCLPLSSDAEKRSNGWARERMWNRWERKERLPDATRSRTGYESRHEGVKHKGNYMRIFPLQCISYVLHRARGSVFGWGPMLQTGRSWVRFTMRSLDFSIDLILPAALWLCGRPNL